MTEGGRDAAQPGAAPADPTRHYVTLLFADLSQSTELAAAMEAEHYAALLAALRRAYRDTMPRHGGLVVRVQGDGLLAMFGHPLTREDEGRRAVEAALDLHQRIAELRPELPPGFRLSLHTGIHAGLVLIGAGDIERGRFELMGSVPNIAARLSDAAAPNEILVSQETLGPASRFFSTGAARPLQLRGRAAPLLVYRVDAQASLAARLGGSAATRHGPGLFVGRAAELQVLEQALAGAMAGTPASVAVAGAAGVGKTRLVGEVLERAQQRGCLVLRGYCDSDLGAEPLQPFRHMLPALRAETTAGTGAETGADTAHEPARALVHPTAHEPAPDFGCDTAPGFITLFTRLAARRPLLLFIDDWQWADDASNQVLSGLRALAQGRLLLLLSTRDSGVEHGIHPAAQTLRLQPLDGSESALAIGARLPGVDPFVAAEIGLHAGGNPLFIEELCHSAARGDSGHQLGRLHAGAGWLSHLVESRLQHLPAVQAELVRVAAVIGNVIPSWVLERLTGHSADSGPVRGLAEHDFIFPGERAGTLRFKHGITRDVIYDSVGLHARQTLHLRIAWALQQQAVAAGQDQAFEAMAYHFGAGGDAAQAAHYAELAGDKALAASALDRARAQYRAALAALDKLALSPAGARRWVGIVHRLGLVCVFDPTFDELALCERAVTLAEQFGDAHTLARTRYWLSYISYAIGDARAAVRHGERALAEAQQLGDEPLAVQVIAALGEAHAAAAQYGPALQLLDQAIAVKRRHRSGRRTNVGLAYSLVCRAYVLGDRGQFGPAHACFDAAEACLVDGAHQISTTIQGWRAAVLLWQGRWAEAQAAAAGSARNAAATRSLSQLSIAQAMGGYARWMLTQDAAALQDIVEATAWLAPRESGLFRSLNHGWLAEGLQQAGRRAEARRHAALALQRARAHDLVGVPMSYRALARDAALRQPAAAQRYLALALRAAQRRDSAHEVAVTQLCAAGILWQHGDAARAAVLLDQAGAAFEQMAMPWHQTQAAALRAGFMGRTA